MTADNVILCLKKIARWCLRGPAGEHDSLLGKEHVLRRVFHEYYDKDSKNSPISRAAFKPTREDTDGLSFSRASFCRPRQILRGQLQRYYVVRMRVSDITKAGMSLVPKPEPNPQEARGHCILPEVTIQNHKGTRELQQVLADLANKTGKIVFRPTAQ